jgi:hypothetical protein
VWLGQGGRGRKKGSFSEGQTFRILKWAEVGVSTAKIYHQIEMYTQCFTSGAANSMDLMSWKLVACEPWRGRRIDSYALFSEGIDQPDT